MDLRGLQSLIKKKSPLIFVLYIFLGMYYSAASITQREKKIVIKKYEKKKHVRAP